MSADADGTHARSLTATLDRDAGAPRWSHDGRQIYFEYEDHGDGKIAVIDLQGKRRVLAEGVGGDDVTRPYAGGAFSVAANGRSPTCKPHPPHRPRWPPALRSGHRAAYGPE